ncbi:MAG: DUF3857 and transglutaminase domain-containing protein [Chitinophagaceae bacterium]|nr:DUF3857 and transglutaminase domain-containing protein [Chitinophagaceae bacterium]
MKRILFLIGIVCVACTLSAQKGKNNDQELPAFGKIDKADLQMKECDFDAKAEALVLLDEGEMDFIYGSGLQMKRRVRIKILSDKGLEWANVHLPYRSESNAQNITNLEAQTYNLDAGGNVVTSKVEKKLIYEKQVNKKYRERVFTFPEVKVGSVIEYKFRHTGIGLVDWYFQSSIPVKYSSFKMDFPEDIEVHTTPYCNRKFEQKNDVSGMRVIKSYAMSNVPGFRDEPHILNEDFYRDRIETKVIAYIENGRRTSRVVNWLQVIKYLMEDEDFGVQVKKNIPRTADLDEKLKNMTEPYQKLKTIYKYVQENMAWNETLGIWALDGVKAAWKDKKGTVGEINLILVNLLKDAGVKAHPVLVSTHDNGIVNTMDAGTYEYPGFFQFNKVMAYVEVDKKVYVLDASQKETPLHLIPQDILMTEALLIEKIETGEWGWKTLWHKDLQAKNVVQVIGMINESGMMDGEATISSFDYARLDRLPSAKKGKDKFIEKYVSGMTPGMTVNDVTFENLESDSLPLVQKVKFQQTLNSSGDYKYFSANVMSGLEKNPFVADSRFSDVFFGYNQSYTLLGNFTLPAGYELEGLPKNIKMIMSDTSVTISRISQVSGDLIMVRVQLEFKKPVYPTTQYEELHEFYKQLFDLLNEQYVIRKKK